MADFRILEIRMLCFSTNYKTVLFLRSLKILIFSEFWNGFSFAEGMKWIQLSQLICMPLAFRMAYSLSLFSNPMPRFFPSISSTVNSLMISVC
jgi:hypothetical protein